MGAAAGAAAQAAVINAVKASGVVVKVEAADFLAILRRMDAPLVVTGQGGVFKKHVQYLTSYRGLAFFTTSPSPLVLPGRTEIVAAKTIKIPEL
ncbi:MAG TPA: hypothetical protein VGD77_05005 [Gemmatimonadaceae bacterium]|jgi:hypothetical protein